jgi:hypothetical protein
MTSTIELDSGEEHQTIEAFGASGAWWHRTSAGGRKRCETACETSGTRDLERICEGPMSDAFQFAPRSVTTLIVDCS